MDVELTRYRTRLRDTRGSARPIRVGADTVTLLAGAVLALRFGLQEVMTGGWVFQVGADAVSTLALTALALTMMRGLATAHRHETAVWRWLTVTAGIVAAAAASRVVSDVVDRHGYLGIANNIDSIMQLTACATVYQALIWWDRGATRIFNPGDWLNGLSAVFAGAAIANLIWKPEFHIVGSGSLVTEQIALLEAAAAVVVTGTVPSVANLAGLATERRFWVCATGMLVLVCAPSVARFSPHATAALEHLPELGVFLIVRASLQRTKRTTPPRQSTTQATTIGAIAVLGVAVVVLALATQLPPTHRNITVIFALGAVGGTSVRMMHIIRDLAHLAETRQEALTDELTGIANRRALMRQLSASDASGRTLLLIDVDRFKDINDRFGHAVGDQLLCVIATRLLNELDTDAQVARLGGDEFAVVLSGDDCAHHLEVGGRMVVAASEAVVVAERRLHVTVSIGVAAVAHDESIDGAELLRRADAAMYVAKSAGSGLAVYDPQLDADAIRRGYLLDQLRSLASEAPQVSAGRLVAYYQPQLTASTGRIHGAEALVRWEHPTLGVLGPTEFLPIMEEHGLMAMVTTTVIRQATKDAASWTRHGEALRVSVNLSPSCLVNPLLLPMVTRALSESGLEPAQLVIEVTETDAMENSATASAALSALVQLGVSVSIDDYGTGYSSLAYLKTLPVSELKIDRSLTSDLVQDRRTEHIVGATIALAHKLQLHVVAEGVEDDATLLALSRLGCDTTQGYLHGAPMPPQEFTHWLAQHSLSHTAGRQIA